MGEKGNDCFVCHKRIYSTTKYVRISTINLETLPDDHAYAHFDCWIDYFDSLVKQKAGERLEMMKQIFMKQIENYPNIKLFLKTNPNTQQFMKILEMPLADVDDNIEVLKRRIRDGKAKKKRRR